MLIFNLTNVAGISVHTINNVLSVPLLWLLKSLFYNPFNRNSLSQEIPFLDELTLVLEVQVLFKFNMLVGLREMSPV